MPRQQGQKPLRQTFKNGGKRPSQNRKTTFATKPIATAEKRSRRPVQPEPHFDNTLATGEKRSQRPVQPETQNDICDQIGCDARNTVVATGPARTAFRHLRSNRSRRLRKKLQRRHLENGFRQNGRGDQSSQNRISTFATKPIATTVKTNPARNAKRHFHPKRSPRPKNGRGDRSSQNRISPKRSRRPKNGRGDRSIQNR